MKRKKTKEDLMVQFIRIANCLADAMNDGVLSPQRGVELIIKAREATEVETARLYLYGPTRTPKAKQSMPLCK